jgi:hypothetical protein
MQIPEEEGEDCPDVLALLDGFETRRRIGPLVKGRPQPAFATLQGKSLPEILKRDGLIKSQNLPRLACVVKNIFTSIPCVLSLDVRSFRLRKYGFDDMPAVRESR